MPTCWPTIKSSGWTIKNSLVSQLLCLKYLDVPVTSDLVQAVTKELTTALEVAAKSTKKTNNQFSWSSIILECGRLYPELFANPGDKARSSTSIGNHRQRSSKISDVVSQSTRKDNSILLYYNVTGKVTGEETKIQSLGPSKTSSTSCSRAKTRSSRRSWRQDLREERRTI